MPIDIKPSDQNLQYWLGLSDLRRGLALINAVTNSKRLSQQRRRDPSGPLKLAKTERKSKGLSQSKSSLRYNIHAACAMKKIGFLSFGHWNASPQSQTRSASNALILTWRFCFVRQRDGSGSAKDPAPRWDQV